MAIKHTYRTREGFETKVITKAKAIRAHCLDCAGWLPGEVVKCTCHTCALYPFRFGNEKGLERSYYEDNKESEISQEEEDEWADLVGDEEDE